MIAHCLAGLGNAQWEHRQLTETFNYAERALAIRAHEVKPRNDLDRDACLSTMGNILHAQGNVERALSCATRAANILSVFEKDDLRLVAALNDLGAIHQTNRKLVEA